MKKYIKTLLICAFLSLFSFGGIYGVKEFKKLKKRVKLTSHFLVSVENGLQNAMPRLDHIALPLELQNVPLGEDDGVVLNVKRVKVRNVNAPYNGTMIEKDGKHLLFFRYDQLCHKCPEPFYTNIGFVELDRDFNQTDKEFCRVNTLSEFSEDPRVVKVGEKLFLSYNAKINNYHDRRTMRLAEFDLETKEIVYESEHELGLQPVEKNWGPFEYAKAGGEPELHYEYLLQPHRILKVSDPHKGTLEHVVYQNFGTVRNGGWPIVWGQLRGGTAPRLIDGEYFSFFHSSFKDGQGIVWYIMGAYTFNPEPPFAITRISQYPLMFKSIYDTPFLNTASPGKRVIFPGGFSHEKVDGKELLHLVCGENDAGLKIITIDKDALLKTMKTID